MRHADGHWVWVQDTSRPVFDDDGELLFFQGFLMDVSTRHEAEERLRAAEQRFRVLVEQMPAAIYTETITPGVDGVEIDYLSPQSSCSSGSARASSGQVANWPAVIHPDDVDSSSRTNGLDPPGHRSRWTIGWSPPTALRLGPRRVRPHPRRGRRARVLAGLPPRHQRAR